jgi:hypothetical protein
METHTFDVVTTYADRHWESHAKRCVESFRQFWKGIPLREYRDHHLEDQSDWLYEFKQRHRQRPADNYRFDAVRFAHKVAAVELAYRLGSADYLIWMDADCVTHSPVDSEWLSGLIGDGEFGYLDRAKKYPEMGFFILKRNERAADFIRNLVWLYRTDELFELAEWHDSWAIEHVRAYMDKRGHLACVSLSGGGNSTGHPFVNGPLGSRMDHCKGNRKQRGKSLPSDLKLSRQEAYWRG